MYELFMRNILEEIQDMVVADLTILAGVHIITI